MHVNCCCLNLIFPFQAVIVSILICMTGLSLSLPAPDKTKTLEQPKQQASTYKWEGVETDIRKFGDNYHNDKYYYLASGDQHDLRRSDATQFLHAQPSHGWLSKVIG